MPKYRITCNCLVELAEHYTVDADTPETALAMFKQQGGDHLPDEDEYGDVVGPVEMAVDPTPIQET